MAASKTKVPRKAALSLPWIAFRDTRLKIVLIRKRMITRMRTGLKIWTKKRMNNETVTMKADELNCLPS